MNNNSQEDYHKLAIEAHKQHMAGILETFKPIFSFAIEGLKTLQLSHGGGLTAVLAFAGVRLNAGKIVPPEIGYAVLTFGFGLGSSLLVWFLAWLSQMHYKKSGDEYFFDFNQPFVHETEQSKKMSRIGDRLRLIAVFSFISSFFAFWLGLYFMYGSVTF